jgi:hypothetical protein
MDLFSAFCQDDRHVFVECKLLPGRRSEKLHHMLPATNVSVHWGIIRLKLMAVGRLVMSSKKATP